MNSYDQIAQRTRPVCPVTLKANDLKSVFMLLDEFAGQVFSTLNVRKKTMATYKSMYRCHISSTLGALDIADITRTSIKETIHGLPPQTAQMTLAVIKLLFREALELELLEKSPVHGVRGPQVSVRPRKFLTWEEIENIHFGRWNHHIRFLALHGLRWSEAVALTESDIRDGKIHVTRSIHGDTKSRAGMRVIPLIGEFKPFPKHPRTLRKALRPHGVTTHSLRHTYAYILKSQGIHVTTAQKLLGHSDPKITLSVYTRVLDTEIDDAGKVLSLMAARAHSSEMRRQLTHQITQSSRPVKVRKRLIYAEFAA
jgi:integrase